MSRDFNLFTLILFMQRNNRIATLASTLPKKTLLSTHLRYFSQMDITCGIKI